MENFNKSVRQIRSRLNRPVKPSKAYNLWAQNYENEDDNLIFTLENQILEKLMNEVEIESKTVLDYGCGTGRNWQKLLSKSGKMLHQLKSKYPESETFLIKEKGYPPIPTGTVDIIFSTLVIAHVKNLNKLFSAWNNYNFARNTYVLFS